MSRNAFNMNKTQEFTQKNYEKTDRPTAYTDKQSARSTQTTIILPITNVKSLAAVIKPISPNFAKTYARMKAFEAQQGEILTRKVKRSEETKKKIYTYSPVIDKHSEKITKNLSPLYTRYSEVLSMKKEKISKLMMRVKTAKEKELQKELTFTPKITQNCRNVRSNEEYFYYMQAWNEHIAKSDAEKRERNQEKLLEGLTFVPVLNSTSKTLCKTLPAFQKRLENDMKMRSAKAKNLQNALSCSFHPQVKSKPLNLQPVFTRLYPSQ